MLISEVKAILENYDQNSGYTRMVKDERHIGELRGFVVTLGEIDRELTSNELLKLALIILGKNTLNGSESSKAFISLANYFGGFDALASLNQAKLLNAARTAFLSRHPEVAKQFAETIMSLFVNSKIDENTLDLLLLPFDTLKNPRKLPAILVLVKNRIRQAKDIPFIDALCLACKLGLYTDEIADYLSVAGEIEIIRNILSFAEKKNTTCLDNDRLLTILKLKNPGVFFELLITFEVSAKHIDILCEVENQVSLRTCAEVKNEKYFAFEIAAVLIALNKAGCLSEETRKAMLQYPDCLEMNAKVINYLTEAKLNSAEYFVKAGALRLPEGQLLSMLELMHKANLLNDENLYALFVRSAYIKTLLSAAKCLANGNVLTQANYNDIVCDPPLSLTFAERNGGKPYPENQPWFPDRGAMDFVEIRKNVRVLSILQHSLFKPGTQQQDITFKKATGKSIAEATDASLIKIAEFCGDGSLERETEASIACLSYFSG